MFDDRRRHPRFPVLFTGEARPTAGQPVRVVCTSISRTGAYFACSSDIAPGTELVVTLRPSSDGAFELSCRVEAVRQTGRGGPESPGFGARWHTLACKQGAAPLRQFVVEQLHWPDAPPPEVDPSGLARFDVNSDGTWIGAAIAVARTGSPELTFGLGMRDADTLAGGAATPARSPASNAFDQDLLQPLTATNPSAFGAFATPQRRRSATFAAKGDFVDDDHTLTTGASGNPDALPWEESTPVFPGVIGLAEPAFAPQAPQAVFAARRRDPSEPFMPIDLSEPPAAKPHGDGTVTLRELPPFAPIARAPSDKLKS